MASIIERRLRKLERALVDPKPFSAAWQRAVDRGQIQVKFKVVIVDKPGDGIPLGEGVWLSES